ncbi:MAG: hypothetical protein HY815_21665 [Candidatus Riflebacteria bacterium]|nr:hypothetical protein [Candidatus Riflebacteria bacterium]
MTRPFSRRDASRRLACAILRHRTLLWALLAALSVASVVSLPHLKLEFGFKGVMREGHPARLRLEAYEREFRSGDTLIVYVHASNRFTAAQLLALRDLSGHLEKLDGVNRVFSAGDILEPVVGRDHQTLLPILGPDLLADEGRTRTALASPPFSDRWIGFLYDSAHTIHALVIQPRGDYEDPMLTVQLLEKIEAKLVLFSSQTGLTAYPTGLFYLNAELLRSTFRDQGALTILGISVLVGCFWALFGNLALAVAVVLVLGLSILLGFGVMVLLGVPMNGLSGNLPILTLVNGLEDVVHLMVFFFATRRRAAPARAAATSIRECLVPNFLTSLTTFGALIVTSATDMVLLRAFGWAICIGVIVEYVVAILFVPLILMQVRSRVEGCLYYRLDGALTRRWIGPWLAAIRSRAHLALWVVLCLGLIVYSSGQHINSNWYRYFVERHPVTRTLGFLESHRFPINTVDCTIPVGMTLDEMLDHPELDADLAAIAAALARVPGVVRVDSWADIKGFIDSRIRDLRFDPSLDARWVKARKAALYRLYLHLGAFEEYYSAGSRKLRLVVSSRVEDSDGLKRLCDRLVEAARPVKTRRLDPTALVPSGRTAYWGEVMGYVSGTFVTNLVLSVLFIFVVFLVMTRSVTVSLVAMVPNVMPVFVMFTAARILGYDLFEGFCVFDSLAIGNSVNDTVHYLTHVRANLDRGLDLESALEEAFWEVGCAMTISSLLVAMGFLASLGAESVPLILSGVYMFLACVVAVAMDVFMHPAMLLRLVRRW